MIAWGNAHTLVSEFVRHKLQNLTNYSTVPPPFCLVSGDLATQENSIIVRMSRYSLEKEGGLSDANEAIYWSFFSVCAWLCRGCGYATPIATPNCAGDGHSDVLFPCIGHINAEDVLHEYLDHFDSAQELLSVDPQVCPACPNPHEPRSFAQGTAFIFVHMYLHRVVRETVFPGTFYRNAPTQVWPIPRPREGFISLVVRSGSRSRP